jgi:hypothetical protein
MSILLKCGCGKQLQVRDDLAGKKARCPGCGTILPVPLSSQKVAVPEGKRKSAEYAGRRQEVDDDESERITRRRPSPTVKPVASEQDTDDAIESSPLEGDELDRDERHRRRKKKKKRSVLFKPLVTLFGINLTPLKLIIVAAVFCMMGVGAFLHFTAPEASVKVVDVYNINEDLGEFTTGGFDFGLLTAWINRQQPTAFVVRQNPDGGFLMVNFKISERTLKKLMGPNQDYTNLVLKKKDVVLQGDGDPVYPLFLFEHEVNAKQFVVKKKSLLGDDDDGKAERLDAGEAFEAKDKPISPKEESPWNHEGLLQINPSSGKSTFKGIRGMRVIFDHGPLPSKEIKITWDQDSFFRFAVKEEPVASEIWLYDWRVTCLFPRPASTKNLKLTVLGKPMKMDYP